MVLHCLFQGYLSCEGIDFVTHLKRQSLFNPVLGKIWNDLSVQAERQGTHFLPLFVVLTTLLQSSLYMKYSIVQYLYFMGLFQLLSFNISVGTNIFLELEMPENTSPSE